ncbi:MAG TPA: DUF1700 domain-containing protein [bacterium]|nr:DUF1700 domain-containing protein [bacterium]
MDKRQYLARLRDSLAGLPLPEVEDIIRDHEEHFRIGAESGKSEADIAVSLGMPEEIARQYRSETPAGVPVVEGPVDRTKMWVAGAILIALNVTVLATPVVSLFWLWLASWIVAWVAAILGAVIIVAGLVTIPVPILNFFASPFLVFFGTGALLLGIGGTMLLSVVTPLAVRIIKWWVNFNIDLARRAGGVHA